MADNDVHIESGAGELTSGISRSSAILMEAAYLPAPVKSRQEYGARFFRTLNTCQDEGVPGPNGRMYITRLSTRTPEAEVKRIGGMPAEGKRGIYDFHTVIFYMNIHLDDPATTRFINATVSFVSLQQGKILTFSPQEKEIMAGIVERAGDRIFLSPSLEFDASSPRDTEHIPNDAEQQFEVFVGPEEKMSVTYHRNYGYSFLIPKDELLEYEGMRKNEQEISFEIFPPMPPRDSEMGRKGMHAIVSLIVRVPCHTTPDISVLVAGKVKGDIWGVVPVKGRIGFLHHGRYPPG
jgi:hypothetical protein